MANYGSPLKSKPDSHTKDLQRPIDAQKTQIKRNQVPPNVQIWTWVACDAVSIYAWNMQMYTGNSASGKPERNQGTCMVLDVIDDLRGPRNVTCNNFFTSYKLARRLLIERRLTVVGTMRKNKPELPRALLNTKGRAVFSSRFAFTSTVTLVSYVPKRNKNVVLLSTLHMGNAWVRATRVCL